MISFTVHGRTQTQTSLIEASEVRYILPECLIIVSTLSVPGVCGSTSSPSVVREKLLTRGWSVRIRIDTNSSPAFISGRFVKFRLRWATARSQII